MRIGYNPEKDKSKIERDSYHRVIIPVYIPNFEGYFKDGLKIFELCIQSLLKTIHKKTRISLYNNASAIEVKEYIDTLYEKHDAIDQVFHSKINVGKINAILAVAKGNLEPLITISDADVLFKSEWQENVEDVFKNFPEAGMVSPVPSSKSYANYTNANWYYGIFKGKIRFENVKDKEGLIKFDESLGRQTPLYKPIHLEKYLVLSNKKGKAVMGAGHFVATLKRKVFDKGTSDPAYDKIQNGVEAKFIDSPNEKLGFLRLSTHGNFAYHLGNVYEGWMSYELKQISSKNNIYSDNQLLVEKNIYKIKVFIGNVSKKILLSSLVRNIYFKFIGLPNSKGY